nr:glycosyltransferase [uncultured Ligilactobacillus sp.]
MLSYTTVIVTFNRKKSVYQALLRQLKQTAQAKKIIVVDNASTDGTQEYIREIINDHAKQIKYLRLNENLGGSGGFYYGMKEALKENTDLIAISDDDASYSEDYFEKIIKAAEKNPQDMAFCGSMYDHGKITPATADAGKILVNENTLKFKGCTPDDFMHGDFYVDNWPFVGPVFRTNLVKKVGLPDKAFFIWFDDSEYAIRMHRLGYKYHVVVDAKIYLNTEIKATRAPLWKKYYGFRNEIFSIEKYGKNKLVANLYTYYMLIKKELSVFIKNKEFKGKRIQSLKLFWNAFSSGKKEKLGKTIDPGKNIKY